jgi:ABC-type spermidine/putrescine transport system permease subunit I
MSGGRVKWERFLWLALSISLLLLVLPQANFIWLSIHPDLGLGEVSDQLTKDNYLSLFTDPLYLHAFWLTVYLSAASAGIALLLGFPTAYALARIGGWIASAILSLILTTSLITIVVKLMGLNLILTPLGLMNSEFGVCIGLIQYTTPMIVVLLFGVVQTIPVGLEEAAAILGATRATTFLNVVLPNARHGLVSSGLIAFNMCMGAFTSAVLLGGGRVRTVPVLIQQMIIQDTSYARGAALSTVLVAFVFVLNLAVMGIVSRRSRHAH